MTTDTRLAAATRLDASADLETVLAAWHSATLRLEQTHETLRAEVHRLNEELERKNRELARKNRLADLGQVASHVAHEVRNTLVPVTLYLSLLRRRCAQDREGQEIVDKIAAGLTALDATVNDLLHFTADRDPQLQTFCLARLVEEVCASLAPQLEAQQIELHCCVPADRFITADPHMYRRAMLNLALNALDAMPAGGRLSITALSDADSVTLEVADSGPGLNSEAAKRAFEPFYSTKPGGTGLGLTIVARIAEVHGGEVSVANAPQGGAVFRLRIPIAGPRPAAAGGSPDRCAKVVEEVAR